MAKHLGFVSLCLCLLGNLSAQSYVPCDEEVIEIDAATLAAYRQYETQADRERDNYQRTIKTIWSADSILTDTPDEWVEYSKDFMSRSVVNFSKGIATVEISIAPNENLSEEELNARLSQALGNLLTSKGTSCSYYSIVDSSQALSSTPVMNGLIDLSQFGIKDPKQKNTTKKHFGSNSKAEANTYLSTNEGLTDEQSLDVASLVVSRMMKAGQKSEKKSPLLLFPRDGGDPIETGTSCSIISLQLSLTKSGLDKSAKLYQNYIEKYAKEYDIEKSLIFAVMEQESHFNPKATSKAPAYGLMQLVPKSAGLASYRYVFKKDVIPTSSYLYVPQQNVQLGTAFLRILFNRFKSVEDDDCRRLCVIAAYNTGAGNVSKAFTGSTNLTNAIPLINKMKYKNLLKHLSTKLNSSEARNYVLQVTEKREKYIGILEE